MSDNGNTTVAERPDICVDSFEVDALNAIRHCRAKIVEAKDGFAEREDFLSTFGVVAHLIDLGVTTQTYRWEYAEKATRQRKFARDAVAYFDSNGAVKDPVGLASLAKQYGLVKS